MLVAPHNDDLLPARNLAAGTAQSRHLSAQPLDAEAERKRRELETAMEEALHHMVTKGGQSPSASWSPAEQPQWEEANRAAVFSRFSLPWMMSLVGLILTLSGVGYLALRRSQMAELKPTAASLAGLGLKVEMGANSVHVSWDKNAPPIPYAKRGILSIKDGTLQNDFILGADQLSRGSVNYYHKTDDVTFHLQVFAADSRTASEVVRVSNGNHVNTPFPRPVSIDLDSQSVRPVALLQSSNAAGSPPSAVLPEAPSIKAMDTGKIRGVSRVVPQGASKTTRRSSPQLSPMANSALPLKRRKTAVTDGNKPAQIASSLARPGVPQTSKPVEYLGLKPAASANAEVPMSSSSPSMEESPRRENAGAVPGVPQTSKRVEYLGLKPAVSANAEVPLSSSSPSMEESPRRENAGAVQLQPAALRSDEPASSLPKENAIDVSRVQERPAVVAAVPTNDSVARTRATDQPQAKASGSSFSSLVQCPGNSDVREIPFASGRPDRKTVRCGEAVTIIRESGDWVRIRTSDGFEGHILRRFVK